MRPVLPADSCHPRVILHSETLSCTLSTHTTLQAVQQFISEKATCSINGGNGTSGNTTLPGGNGVSCKMGCSEHGQCIDGQCYCNTGNCQLAPLCCRQ